MLTLLTFFGLWIAGVVVLFFYRKNKNNSLTPQQDLFTYILSGIIGIVFSYAAWKANILHWVSGIAFVGLSAYITNLLLPKNK